MQILQHAPSSEKEKLATHFLTSIPTATFNSDARKRRREASQWVAGIVPLMRHILRIDDTVVSTGLLRGTFHAPEGLGVYIDIMRALSLEKDAEHLAPYVTPHPDDAPEDLDVKMKEVLDADLFDKQVLEALKVLHHVNVLQDVSWTQTTNTLTSRVEWNENREDDILQTHLEALLVLGSLFGESHVQARIGNNAGGRGNLSHYIHAKEKNKEVVALCVLLRTMYSADQNRGSNQGNAQAGHNLYLKILQNPSDTAHVSILDFVARTIARLGITYDVLQSSSQSGNTTKFLKAIVGKLAGRQDSARHLTANVVCAFPNLIHGNVPQSEAREVFQDADEDGAVHALLRGLSKADWLDDLKDGTDRLHVVAALSSKDTFVLGAAFSDALHEHATWMLDTGTSSTYSAGEWRKVVSALTDDAKEALLGKIQRMLLERCGESVAPVLGLYREMLSQSSTARQETIRDPNAAFSNRFTKVLDRANPPEIQWLADVISKRPELQNDTGDAYWNDVRERVVAKASDATGALRDAFEDLANAMSLSLPGPDAKDTGNR